MGGHMPTIVNHYDKKTGRIQVFESTPHYDPVTKQSRPIRKYLGTRDPVTNELIPSSGKRGRKPGSKNTVRTDIPASTDDLMKQNEQLSKINSEQNKTIKKLEEQVNMLTHRLNTMEDAYEQIIQIIRRTTSK